MIQSHYPFTMREKEMMRESVLEKLSSQEREKEIVLERWYREIYLIIDTEYLRSMLPV